MGERDRLVRADPEWRRSREDRVGLNVQWMGRG